jgi:hypothetical protein
MTPEELSREREELQKRASADISKVKHKILEQMHKRAEPFIQHATWFLNKYDWANKENIRQAIIDGEYKRIFEDSFEVENDADHNQMLSFFNIADTHKSDVAKDSKHVYADIFFQFKDAYESTECLAAYSHPSLLPGRQFCKEQLHKIGLGLNDGPSIQASTYTMCTALYNFRHTNKKMAHIQGYKNAHQDLAQSAFVCVNQTPFKNFVASQLVKLGVDKEMLTKSGFDIEHEEEESEKHYCIVS